VINMIWNEVCQLAHIRGKTPHSARHAMGRHIMQKTGNAAAVQRQLGHSNVVYSLQYARITDAELQAVARSPRSVAIDCLGAARLVLVDVGEGLLLKRRRPRFATLPDGGHNPAHAGAPARLLAARYLSCSLLSFFSRLPCLRTS
jgi:Phage integrase family